MQPPVRGRAPDHAAAAAGPAGPGQASAAGTPIPLSLYVHVPWCIRKCPYCDFNSHHLRGELPAAAYVDALLADLALDLADGGPERPPPLVSIFIGGGTPSLLPAAELARLLDGIAARLALAPDVEITLEANPGALERTAFADVRAAGVNRLSLGIQSFDDAMLRALGRVHNAAAAQRAVAEALAVFERVNLDLMYALPGQDLAGCRADLRRALAFGISHLSHYELTLEPGTVFARYPPGRLPDEDLACDMREASAALLDAAGLAAYEVSAWASAPQWRARHNLNYWTFGDYLGIGAGAHGKRTLPTGVVRSAKVRRPGAYLAGAGTPARLAERRQLPSANLPAEFMLNALRLSEGFDDGLLEARLGPAAPRAAPREIARIRAQLASLTDEGLMARDGERWRPTPRGRLFLNDLQARFLP